MKRHNQSGFAVVETLLVVVILAILGGTGYFVWHARHNADRALSNAAKSQPVIAGSQEENFARCKSAKGSKILQTSPEQCVYQNGHSYTDVSATDTTTDKVVQTKFSKLPQAFKTAFIANAISGDKMCFDVTNGLPTDDSDKGYDETAWYITDKFVSVGECHSAAIYAKYQGAWTFVGMTQFAFACDSLHKYNVPSSILTEGTGSTSLNECVDATNQLVAYSQKQS